MPEARKTLPPRAGMGEHRSRDCSYEQALFSSRIGSVSTTSCSAAALDTALAALVWRVDRERPVRCFAFWLRFTMVWSLMRFPGMT